MIVTKAPYAWVIEYRNKTYDFCSWQKHINRKIYHTDSIAMDAILAMKKTGIYDNYEFRILPLFL